MLGSTGSSRQRRAAHPPTPTRPRAAGAAWGSQQPCRAVALGAHMSGVKYLTAIRRPSASSSSRFLTTGMVGSTISAAMLSGWLLRCNRGWRA